MNKNRHSPVNPLANQSHSGASVGRDLGGAELGEVAVLLRSSTRLGSSSLIRVKGCRDRENENT